MSLLIVQIILKKKKKENRPYLYPSVVNKREDCLKTAFFFSPIVHLPDSNLTSAAMKGSK